MMTMNTLINFRTIMLLIVVALTPAMAADLPVVQVYKSPTCGCCSKWVEHLRKNGFTVDVTNVADVTPIKQANSVPPSLSSCHTALVDGYIIEGHVPVEDIFKLLKERPAVAGIAVPGMPIGSPGMEGRNPQPFKVVAFGTDGETKEFSSHEP
jgi:hypothetical protein